MSFSLRLRPTGSHAALFGGLRQQKLKPGLWGWAGWGWDGWVLLRNTLPDLKLLPAFVFSRRYAPLSDSDPPSRCFFNSGNVSPPDMTMLTHPVSLLLPLFSLGLPRCADRCGGEAEWASTWSGESTWRGCPWTAVCRWVHVQQQRLHQQTHVQVCQRWFVWTAHFLTSSLWWHSVLRFDVVQVCFTFRSG